MNKNKNKFDVVMDYIDANITKPAEEIKRGIFDEAGWNSLTFGNCFAVLTGETLFHYITGRKLYFAAKELFDNPDKPICDIALEYGYSEQSAFTRAMKVYHKCTPGEIRKGRASVPDDKYALADFSEKEPETRLDRIFCNLRGHKNISPSNIRFLTELTDAADLYGLDIDTCYQIADLAERIEVPVRTLIDTCWKLMIEIHDAPDYIPPEAEAAIECGIESDEELADICEFYQCKYYDLDAWMVDAYRDRNSA